MGKIISLYLFTLVFCCTFYSQVETGSKIKMTGTLTEDRQVLGISSTPTSLNQAVNAQIIESNYLKFSEATGNGNQISVTLPVNFGSYTEGMSLYVLTNKENTGNVSININNIGDVPILTSSSIQLNPGQIIKGQIIHIIYNGSNFQILSDLIKQCPAGFTKSNDNYCIEINERPAAIFYDAIIACGDIGAKLCSWDDWYYACQDNQTSLEINDEIGNWEWVDEGGNNITTAKNATNTAHIVGETRCEDRFTGPIKSKSTDDFVLLPYRCCTKIK